jgi:ABC-type multidrug transport system fused ATPase/permease subunit
MCSEIQNLMTSSQRIHEYTLLESEDDLEKEKDKALVLEQWPQKGQITFENISMAYRPGLEPSIHGLNCKIEPGMKVGIVGRTGAGKSSILQVLFRLTYCFEGRILIDG